MFWPDARFGPNYRRPLVKTPENFRAPEPLPTPQATSLADLKWWEVFKDEKLQELIRAALAANYDLRDAVARVDAARANLGITRSNQFPQVGASGDLQFTRLSRDGSLALPSSFARSQIAIGVRHRWIFFHSRWTFGDGFGAPQRRLARIC